MTALLEVGVAFLYHFTDDEGGLFLAVRELANWSLSLYGTRDVGLLVGVVGGY